LSGIPRLITTPETASDRPKSQPDTEFAAEVAFLLWQLGIAEF
jgi:hypothetical protein